jgi:site-specific DNA-methyltransferase (adenine-specific)
MQSFADKANPPPFVRKEVIGNCTLYLGNSVELLPHIRTVDHCISDPPYGVDVYLRMRNPDSAGGNRKHKIKGGDSITAMKKGAIGDLGQMYLPVAQFCASNVRRWSLLFSDIESCHLWRDALVAERLRYVRTGVWVKPDAMPQMTGDRPGVGFEPFTVAHRADIKMRWNGGGRPALYTCGTSKGSDRPDHPCPKPLRLMRAIVADYSDPGETVLDPFMGSGTTGIACALLGRAFIGIEMEEKYFDIACQRILDSQRQSDMFVAHIVPGKPDAFL